MSRSAPLLPFRSPLRDRGVRVLHVLPDGGQWGGIESLLVQTVQALSEDAHYQPIVACTQGGRLYKTLKEMGIPVHGFRSFPGFSHPHLRFLDFWLLLQWTWIVLKARPALVHVHIGARENMMFKALGLPVVLHCHGYGSLYSLQSLRNPFKQLVKRGLRTNFRQAAKKMDAVLVVSRTEATRLVNESYLTFDQPQVVPNGIPVEILYRQAAACDAEEKRRLRLKLGLDPDASVLAFLGRLDETKNPLGFLKLAEQLLSDTSFPTLQCVMAGEGPLRTKLQKQIEKSPHRGRIHWVGHTPDPAAFLLASDLLVHMPQAEGFGLTVLTAMALGVPVLTRAVGGLGDLLEGVDALSACLLPFKASPEDWKSHAHTLLTLPDTQRLAMTQALQARARAFDERVYLARVKAVYDRLLPATASPVDFPSAMTEKKPAISVILPVYQGEATILNAVNSVMAQTASPLELIVVDDGSTDDTLVKLLAVRDDRLKVARQENQGVAAARNRGMAMARGDYFTFIDADDVWLPEKLATELETLHRWNNPVGLLYSSYVGIDAENQVNHLPKIHTLTGDLARAVLEQEGLFLPSTTLIHRQVFEHAGGFPEDCYHEDRAFFIRACQKFPAFPTGKRLVRYRQTMDGRCRSILANEEDALAAELSIVTALSGTLPSETIETLRTLQLRNLCMRFLMYGHSAAAKRLYRRSFRTAPGILWRMNARLFLTDLKGKLALLSLWSGLNLLLPTRVMMQTVMKTVFRFQEKFQPKPKAPVTPLPVKQAPRLIPHFWPISEAELSEVEQFESKPTEASLLEPAFSETELVAFGHPVSAPAESTLSSSEPSAPTEALPHVSV